MELQQAGVTGHTLSFRFTGSGDEYFRIWIVNLFLSLLTLGIYSAWAKVRRNRYFHGNTRLGDSSFEYLANPVAILKGRLIAFAAFVVYATTTHLWPATSPLFGLVFLALLPWLVVRSLTFRARNTAFRNIRFGFKGTYGEAVVYYAVMPVLLIFTLGLLYPYIVFGQKRLLVANSAYGTTSFSFKARQRDFYRLYGKLALLFLAGAAVTVTLVPVIKGGAFAVAALVYLFAFAYRTSQVANLLFNSAALGENTFRSDLRTRDIFSLYLTNTLAIVATVGLFIPWAQVRLARYRAERLRFIAAGDLDHFVGAEQAKIGSAGEELSEMFDVDLAI